MKDEKTGDGWVVSQEAYERVIAHQLGREATRTPPYFIKPDFRNRHKVRLLKTRKIRHTRRKL